MSDEMALIITPTTPLAGVAVSDDKIVEINHAFERLCREQRQKVVTLFRQLPSMIQVANRLVEGNSYEAIISPEVLEQIKKGTAEWDQHKSGHLGPTIRDTTTGKIIGQVELKEISPDILSSLTQLAAQRTLAEIVQKLEVIDQKITDVLEGQRNDRLSLVEAGMQLYLQAMAASKPETRHQLLIEAVDKLTVGRQQLILSLEADIRSLDEQLPLNSWHLLWRSLTRDVAKQVEEKARPVQESFQAILRASYVLACAYQALNELDSLLVSLQPLRKVLLEVGTMGEEIARWLPYHAERPPEELWHSGLLLLAEDVAVTNRQLEFLDAQTIKIAFETAELVGGADD